MLTPEEARSRLLRAVNPVAGSETLRLDAALGRFTAEDLKAPISLPPFPSSAMDGYAVRTQDPEFSKAGPYRMKVVAHSYAGRPWRGVLSRGAVRIFTGAVVPEGADSIVVQEEVRIQDDLIEFTTRPVPMRHIRSVGDDVHAGDLLLPEGTRLRAFEVGWLAACGFEKLRVRSRPRVGIFATGDELREPSEALEFGQIYESNRVSLRSLAHELPVITQNLGILPDNPRTLREVLCAEAKAHDALITSGGVSVGETDHVRDVVSELGRLDFWKVAIKPGKPFAVGHIGDCLFMGLPGNPVSAMVTFLLFGAPAFIRMAGGTVQAPLECDATLAEAVRCPQGRVEFQRGRYEQRPDGLRVAPTGAQGSNRIASFHGANCLIRLAPGDAPLKAGSRVPILPFNSLLKGGD